MRVVVINTGTELLLGDVINTHAAFIAQQILPLGLRIERQITVPDGDAIRTALLESFSHADLVFVTGGLGPTTDDITREITAELLQVPLRHDATVMAAIEARAAARGFRLTDRIPRQADVPEGATVLPNEFGTAPGLYLPAKISSTIASPHLFLLPGPPRELRPMFGRYVLPLLSKIIPRLEMTSRNFHITGIGESHVEEAVGARLSQMPGLELGYCAKIGEVILRLIGHPAVIAEGEQLIRESLGDAIFSTSGETLEQVVVQLLTRRGETIVTAESCTGGLLAHRLTNVPGASAVFLEGFITYSDESKTALLRVPRDLICAHGAVSVPVARAMAEGARERAASTFALATTGIAGPSGGTAEKPVGTVFIALAAKNEKTLMLRQRFPADRETFKQLVTQTALDLLRRRLGVDARA